MLDRPTPSIALPNRLRKAWRVAVRGHGDRTIYYAPNASRARAKAIDDLSSAWGINWGEALAEIRSCRRAPESDVRLPPRHPLAASLNPEILHCVVHAYGGKGFKAGYRDYFYTSDDDWHLKAALYHGLFSIYRRDPGRNGQPDSISYELTPLGKNVARGEVETYPRFS